MPGRYADSGGLGRQDNAFRLGERQECHINGETVLVVYAHLKEIHKHDGEFISQSGILGLSGNTGKSTGPHLHLGARIKDMGQFLDFEFEENHVNA
jgi:murein DD-endopeptidase MepM/ murein hydrolase activator NlpD